MKEERAVCSTMPELLARMADGGWGSRKYIAVLHRFPSTPQKLFVREHFDSGKGASNAFSSEDTPVAKEVFEKALMERYISGKLEPGYVSTHEFLITKLGEQVHGQLVQMTDIALESMFPGKGMRVCDILPYLLGRFPGATEEWAEEVLNELVRRGYAEPYEQDEQKFYLRTQRTKL